ncbi:MAG: MarR family winged helix-turn-helix transcriptional regulator [Coprobacillaceae bacterium]
MQRSQKLGVIIKRINNTFEAELNKMLKKYDITKTQCDILMYLDRHKHEKNSQRDIEKYFGISNPTVSGILNRLESKEFIIRMSCEKDARVRYIKSTEKANTLIGRIKSNFNYKEAQLKVGLTPEEEEQLFNYLNRILQNITK